MIEQDLQRPAAALSNRQFAWCLATPLIAGCVALVLSVIDEAYVSLGAEWWHHVAFLGVSVLFARYTRDAHADVAWYLKGLRDGRGGAWLLFVAGGMLLPNLYPGTLLRRVVFMCWALPIAVLFIPSLVERMRARPVLEKVAAGFLLAFLIVVVVPGVHAPPFIDGIGGNRARAPEDESVGVGVGVQLVRDDGERIWFSNGLISPSNFIGRQTLLFSGDPEQSRVVLAYYYTLYQRHFPVLREGRMPNQRYLGVFGYPGHNLYRKLPYAEFPPERIVAVAFVNQHYDLYALAPSEHEDYAVLDVRSGRLRTEGEPTL